MLLPAWLYFVDPADACIHNITHSVTPLSMVTHGLLLVVTRSLLPNSLTSSSTDDWLCFLKPTRQKRLNACIRNIVHNISHIQRRWKITRPILLPKQNKFVHALRKMETKFWINGRDNYLIQLSDFHPGRDMQA